MGELSNLIYCPIARTGWMIEYFQGLPRPVQKVLKSVTQMQRRKFKKYDLIPLPVLEAMWHLNWLPGHKAPEQGMKILELTEFLLKNKSYKNDQVETNANWLYGTIVKEDIIGKKTFEKKTEFPTFTVQISLESKAKTSVRAR